MDSKKSLWILTAIFVVALGGLAHAVDHPPTYDYTDRYNLSCTNSPGYNTTMPGLIFGPNGNQKCTLAKDMTTTEFPLNTTPYTFFAWIYPQGPDITGQATAIALFKGFNFTNNTGIELRFMLNGTGYFRVQAIHGANITTGALTAGFNLSQAVPVAFIYNGSQCWGYVDNSTTANYNSTCAGVAAAAANAAIPDGLCGEGTAGGGANGMCNATLGPTLLYNRTSTAAEFDAFVANGSVSNSGLLANWTMQNTTSAQITINLTSFLKFWPANFLGVHAGSTVLTTPMWCYNLTAGYFACNAAEAQALANVADPSFIRKPIDLGNLVASYSGVTGNATWNVVTGAGQNFKNINIHRNLLSYANNTSKYVIFNSDSIPTQLADNDSECNYGVSSTGPTLTAAENQVRCDPTNHTILNHIIAQFLVDVGCFNYTSGVCALESFNEYYLRQFYNTNATAVPDSGACTVRVAKVLNYWNQSGRTEIRAELTSMGYNPNSIRWYGSPSFTNESSSCGNAMANAWAAAYPYLSTDGADMFIEHTYTSQCSAPPTNELQASDDANEAAAAIGNYTNHWGVTEGNIRCNGLNNDTYNNQSQYASYLAQDIVYSILSTTKQIHTQYKFDSINTATNESQPYIDMRGSALSVTNAVELYGPYFVLNATKFFGDNSSVYTCTVNTTTQAVCLFSRTNITNGHLMIVNRLGNQLDIDNVTLVGGSITAATKLVPNQTQTVSAGVLDPSYLGLYDVQTFQITMSATNLSATYTPAGYIVNISEPANQTFTVSSITNPGNQTYNISWFNTTGGVAIAHCQNLTSCTQLGNYTSAGQYNWSVVIVGETNTLTKVWLLQINQTNSTISFATTTPSNTFSMSETSTQIFSYTLNNPDNISNTATWFYDGVNQTACFNSTSCSLTPGAGSSGAHTMNVTVVSLANTVSNQWSITVITSGAAATNDSCENIAGGFGVGAGMLALVFIVVFGGFAITTINRSDGFDIEKLTQLVIAGLVVGILLVISVAIISVAAGTC